MWTENFHMFKLDLEKAEETEIKLPTSVGSSEKQESSRKTSTSVLLSTPKPLTVWITMNYRKFFKPGFNSMGTVNFQMFMLVLEKGRTRDEIANICWIIENAREFQKNIYFCFIDYAKAFDCVDHNKLENS